VPAETGREFPARPLAALAAGLPAGPGNTFAAFGGLVKDQGMHHHGTKHQGINHQDIQPSPA
jgi:hypothetical protein